MELILIGNHYLLESFNVSIRAIATKVFCMVKALAVDIYVIAGGRLSRLLIDSLNESSPWHSSPHPHIGFSDTASRQSPLSH